MREQRALPKKRRGRGKRKTWTVRVGEVESRDWKDAGVLAMAVSEGRLFQSTIVREKNESFRQSALQYGTGLERGWLHLQVLCGWVISLLKKKKKPPKSNIASS